MGYYPKLNELNGKIYNTDYDLVLFYKSFNMFHEIYDYLKQIEFCINSHVDVYSHMEFIDSTAGSEGLRIYTWSYSNRRLSIDNTERRNSVKTCMNIT